MKECTKQDCSNVHRDLPVPPGQWHCSALAVPVPVPVSLTSRAAKFFAAHFFAHTRAAMLAASQRVRLPALCMASARRLFKSGAAASQPPVASFDAGSGGSGGGWSRLALAAPAAVVGLVAATVAGVAYISSQRRADLIAVRGLPLVPGCPIVFLDVADGDKLMGRLIIQLRADVCPRAAANFRALCTREHGWGYAASPLHGGEPRSRSFGGDFFGGGSAGHSIYGAAFADEDLVSLRHIGPGTVSMRSAGPDANQSQFFIALRRLPEFDGLAQVVGNVVEGFEVLDALDKSLASSGRFEAGYDFRIARAGELRGYTKPAADADDAVAAAGGDAASAALLAALAVEAAAASPPAERG